MNAVHKPGSYSPRRASIAAFAKLFSKVLIEDEILRHDVKATLSRHTFPIGGADRRSRRLAGYRSHKADEWKADSGIGSWPKTPDLVAKEPEANKERNCKKETMWEDYYIDTRSAET